MTTSSERTLPLERLPTRRLAPRRSRPYGSRPYGVRRHPAPRLSPLYTLAIESAPAAPRVSMKSAMPVPAHTSPAGALQVQVIHRVEATESAVTLWLARPGTHEAPASYAPGQFTTLALSIDGVTHYRSYSLCGDGSADWPWEITVKREGLVSSILCDEVAPGAMLRASVARGAFTLPTPLDPRVPLIFVAAGSGITPIYGMLRAIASLPLAQRPPVQLHYADRDQSEMIFARELARLDPGERWLRQWRYLSIHGRRLTPDRLLEIVECDGTAPNAADWYICAPERLKHNLARALHWRRVSPARVHMEVFASPGARPLARTEPPRAAHDNQQQRAAHTRLRLAESGNILDARPGETLLETLERHGYRPSFGCRAGACGECKLRVLAGHVAATDTGMLTSAEHRAGYVLSCTAQPQGEVTLAGVESPTRENAATASGQRKIAATPPSRRGFRAVMRVGLLAATLGLFTGAWRLTSPAALTAPSNTSNTSGASHGIHTSAPAAHPKPTPVSGGIGH